MSKILVAMSGGVDSSVVAYLLKQQGHETIGVTMKLYEKDLVGENNPNACCTRDDIEDARSIAESLGMEHHVFDFSPEFEEKVIKKFIADYEAGLTPNPCVHCNRHMKFARLHQRAKELGCDFVATGHYAQIEYDEDEEKYILKKGVNEKKDQSYVLYSLSQEQLAHTLLPLGGMSKNEVRQIAQEAGLINAQKQDSQDICFVQDGDYKAFLEKYQGKKYPEGNIRNKEGEILGKHSGTIGYTIGQRKGLGLACGHPVYVTKKDMEKNELVVGPESELYSNGLIAEDWNWLSMDEPKDVIQVMARTRYQQKETEADLYTLGEGRVKLIFKQPKRAITTGQAVVIYDGNKVLGGGIIVEVIN